MDYSHILTNMNNHISKNGYAFCPKEHYEQLVNEWPDILSRSIVIDRIDMQNIFMAKKFFSSPVAKYMEDCGFGESAKFINLVRNWFEACDERGILANHHVEQLYNMHVFLTEDIDFDHFPSAVTGRYIKGMPVLTFKALLQSISTRIYLYKLSQKGTYNTRSVSTLCSESFFLT